MKKITAVASLTLLSLFLTPLSSYGQGGETPFGGMHLVTFNSSMCSCNGGNSHWILDYKSGSLLKLYFAQGQSKVFANNNIDYGTWQVGTYSKGSSQPCKIGEEPYCVTLQNDGTYGRAPGTGTSMNPVLRDKQLFAFELSNQSLTSVIQSARDKFSALWSAKRPKASF